MRYSLIDEWVEDFKIDNNYDDKSITVEVFPQIVYKGIKIEPKQITVIYENNLEMVSVYCDTEFLYTIICPSEKFKEDLQKHNISLTGDNY